MESVNNELLIEISRQLTAIEGRMNIILMVLIAFGIIGLAAIINTRD